MGPYQPANMMRSGKWGSDLDLNLFASNHRDRTRFASNGTDAHSFVGDPQFADPAKGDFTVQNAELAKAINFKNFPMNRFGVQKPSLKAIAETPVMPDLKLQIDASPQPSGTSPPPIVWMGTTLREPRGLEMSAYGVPFETRGVAIEQIDAQSPLGGAIGLEKGDLILWLNDMEITGIEELRKALDAVVDGQLRLRVIRNQRETALSLTVQGLVKP
jgi:hypothetical protein